MRLSNHLQIGISCLYVICMLIGLWYLRSPLHHLPLERDEGAYALIATRWAVGDVLYRDLFDHKPAFVYLIYALAPLFGTDPVASIRSLATIYLMLSGLVTMSLSYWLYGRSAALSSLLLTFVYGSSLAFQGLIFNTEMIMTLPAMLACLLALAGLRWRRAGLLLLSGIGVGVAMTAKLVALLLLLPLVLAVLRLEWSWRKRFVLVLLVCIAVSLPILAFAAMLWYQGGLMPAYEAIFVYSTMYAQESLRAWSLSALWTIWYPMLPLFLPALLGLLVSSSSQEHRLVALWGMMLLASALLSLRAYPHYYLAVVPFLSMWVAAGLAWLAHLWRHRGSLILRMLILIALVVQPISAAYDLGKQTPHVQSGMLYSQDGWMFFGIADVVAAYVQAHVSPDQTMFVWAAEPEIYYLARRAPATRFIYDYPLTQLPGALDAVLHDLRSSPPPLIVTYHDVRPIGFTPFIFDYGYSLRTTIAGYDIYQR